MGRALDDGGCGGLEKRLRVHLSAGGALQPLALPPLQALVVLNIPSWGAGVDLWSEWHYIDDYNRCLFKFSRNSRLNCFNKRSIIYISGKI